MGTVDYGAVLDGLPDAAPTELLDLLQVVAGPLGARDVRLYLSDFQGITLQLVTPLEGVEASEFTLDVAGSVAGRTYRTGEAVTLARDDGASVWVPLLERGERTGVLAMTVPEATDDVLTECIRLGRFAGLLVRSFARTTDLFHLRRRRQSMTFAAGMQWDLLPPLTIRTARALACGRLEPAYEIAGDAFDYAMNETHLHAGVFDGMGHGVHSTLMTTLAVGAYRHARRAGDPIPDIYAAIDRAIADQYDGDAFVTAAFCRLRLADGILEWTSAGHPGPLLMRDRRVIRQLQFSPLLPLGLSGVCTKVAIEALEPGDCVLFFTDGVIEERSATGEEFGVDRLAEHFELHAASDAEPDEVLRRIVDDVTGYSANKLRDDASLLLVRWSGEQQTA